MRKYIFFAALFFAAFSFTSCEDETNDGTLTIKANFANGNKYKNEIDEVRAITCSVYTIDVSKFRNGCFKIILPYINTNNNSLWYLYLTEFNKSRFPVS